MANERQRQGTQDQFAFAKYEGAQVAQLYAQGKDFKRAHLALLNTPIDSDGKLLLEGDEHYSRPEGILSASQIYGGQFHKGLRAQTIAGLAGFYAAQIAQLSAVARGELNDLLGKYKDKTYGEIEDEYHDALSDLEDIKDGKLKRKLQKESGLNGDALEAEIIKRAKEAKETREKYAPLVEVLALYQEGRNSPIMERTRTSRLEQTAKGE